MFFPHPATKPAFLCHNLTAWCSVILIHAGMVKCDTFIEACSFLTLHPLSFHLTDSFGVLAGWSVSFKSKNSFYHVFSVSSNNERYLPILRYWLSISWISTTGLKGILRLQAPEFTCFSFHWNLTRSVFLEILNSLFQKSEYIHTRTDKCCERTVMLLVTFFNMRL